MSAGIRTYLIGGAATVAAVAMAASAATLAALGRRVGWPSPLHWALPVSVDVLALVAGVCWLAAGIAPGARSLGQRLTLVSVAVSVALNAVSHLVVTGHMVVTAWLVITVSAVPPLAAALSVHLTAAISADPVTTPQTEVTTQAVTEAVTTPAEAVTQPVTEPVTTAQPEPDQAEVHTASPQENDSPVHVHTSASPQVTAPEPELAPATEAEVHTEVHTEVTTPAPEVDTEAVTPTGRLSTSEARAVMEECYRDGVSVREAARRSTRAHSRVQAVYTALADADTPMPGQTEIPTEAAA